MSFFEFGNKSIADVRENFGEADEYKAREDGVFHIFFDKMKGDRLIFSVEVVEKGFWGILILIFGVLGFGGLLLWMRYAVSKRAPSHSIELSHKLS